MNTADFTSFFADLRKKRLGLAIVFALCALGAGVSAILQCYFLNTQYDIFYHVYDFGSRAPSLLFSICLCVCVLILGCALLLPKSKFMQEETEPIASVKALWLCVGIGQLFVAFYLIAMSQNGIFSFLLIFASLVSALYCVLASGVFATVTDKLPLLRIWTQFGVLAFFLVRIFELYFDMTSPMTAPLKTIEMITALALCLYLLCALRADLEIPFVRLSYALCGIAFLLCTLCGVGSAYLWILAPAHFTQATAFALLYLTWAILLGVKLWHACIGSFFRRMTDYLVFGVLTTAVNFLCYFLLTRWTSMPLLVANILAFVFSVLFAYAVNKFFVFEEKTRHGKALLYESGIFFASRIFTLGLEELILWSFVYLLDQYDLVAKIIAAVVVVITNYLTGRFLVFQKKRED